MSNILNVVVKDVEPEVVPTPDTGSFTVTTIEQTGGNIAPSIPAIIVGGGALLLIVAIVLKLCHKKAFGFNKSSKLNLSSKASFLASLFLFALGTTGLLVNTINSNAATDDLDITPPSGTITVERVKGESAYVAAKAEVTINEATAAGYDLFVYAPEGNELTSEGQDSSIAPVAEPESKLTANTWGVTAYTTEDITTDSAIWNPVSETADEPTLVATTEEATATGEKAAFYYGIYVDKDLPAGNYTVDVAYEAKPHYYTITFDVNGGNELPEAEATKSIVAGSKLGTLPTTTKDNYVFKGWYTAAEDGEQVTSDTVPTGNTTYYARLLPKGLTFNVGDNIETIVVSDPVTMSPAYATAESPLNIQNPVANLAYTVTVVPKSNYILNSWSGDTAGLESSSLLTTTYTIPGAVNDETSITLTANGVAGSYANMKDITRDTCPTAGTNVTDARDGKSYTVANISNYCYMLSNIRLDSTTDGTTPRILTSEDSDITPNSYYSTFTMPTEAWESSAQNYYCKAIMAVSNGEYYYNWYAARANSFECANPTSNTNATGTNENKALGSICPAGWTLPYYSGDVDPTTIWSNGLNPGKLAKTGSYNSGSQNDIGSSARIWSKSYSNNSNAYALLLQSSVSRNSFQKYLGYSVRCSKDIRPRFTITLDVNGGDSIGGESTKTVLVGQSVGSLPNAVKDGYMFTGWYTAPEGGDLISYNTIPTSNVTYYAQFAESYNITLNGNGYKMDFAWFYGETLTTKLAQGQPLSQTKYFYDDEMFSVGLPGSVEFDHPGTATFLGWFTEAEGGEQVTANTIPTGDATYYAHWEMQPYTITYSLNGAEGNGCIWFDDSCSDNAQEVQVPAGSSLSTATISGEHAGFPGFQGREEYESAFLGWFTAASGGTQVTANTVPTGNTTYYAHWGTISFSITFDAGSGYTVSGGTSRYEYCSVPAGQRLGSVSNCGYTIYGNVYLNDVTCHSHEWFVGWFTEPNGQGTKIGVDTIPTSSTTYYGYCKYEP